MKIVRIATGACLASISIVICAMLPAGALAGAAGKTAPAVHSVAVNIVEYGPVAGHRSVG